MYVTNEPFKFTNEEICINLQFKKWQTIVCQISLNMLKKKLSSYEWWYTNYIIGFNFIEHVAY